MVEVERDDTSYGNELLRGWGKTLRIGLLLSGEPATPSELDLLISNALIVDPVIGIVKTNIGVKDGRIVGVGRAGNPDILDEVDLLVGPNTAHIPAHGLIATPGAVDTHVHLKYPGLVEVALSSGSTTLVTAGLEENPAANLHHILDAFEQIPLNLGIQGRASSYRREPLEQLLEAGACGLKVHEDYGGQPTVVDAALSVAEDYDVAVALHTDGMNESGYVEETLDAISGRAVHAYHVEGAGGGHIPDSLTLCSARNVISSSTTPTVPFGPNSEAEHQAMMWVVHGMNRAVPSNREMAALRVRDWTMLAEGHLQEIGAISLMTSDSIGMGRIGEVARRTWQLAHTYKSPAAAQDNQRVLQYMAKYTINPARTHGLARWVGSLETGKIADIVLWHPAFFGVKPDLVLKSGYPVWGALGSAAASVQFAEPVTFAHQWGALGQAAAGLSFNFVAEASVGLPSIRGRNRRALPVAGTRAITKDDMLLNTACPNVRVDSVNQQVYVDEAAVPPTVTRELPLNRRYILA